MPDQNYMPALRAALKMHEIGKNTPYKLYFAAKGKSGGSFGFMQGDLAAGQKIVTKTFMDIMALAGADKKKAERLLVRLSQHVIGNPLSVEDTAFVNGALATHRDQVDAMDDAILADVYKSLDLCIDAAQETGRTISGKGQLYAALWINMSGPPTKLKTWIGGGNPNLPVPVPQAPTRIQGSDIRTYLLATSYYQSNPKNVAHLDESVQAGELLLP